MTALPVAVVNGIGYLAAASTTFSLVPQLMRIVKLRSAREISLVMFSLFSLGVLLWLIYGILVHSRPVIVANAVTLVFAVAILALKLRFDEQASQELRARSQPKL